MYMPVIGLCDTDVDPRNLDYPIPSSSMGLQIQYFYTKLFVQAIQRGMDVSSTDYYIFFFLLL